MEQNSKKKVPWIEAGRKRLCIIKHKDGKAGLLPVMFFLGTVSSEAGSVFEQQIEEGTVSKEKKKINSAKKKS